MGLRDIESTLPAGFRFCPSDVELVCHYLQKKVANERVSQGTMVEVDLHTNEPWELPEVARLSDNEWYFFSFRDRKYATGLRTNRATKTGYWKATGKDRTVHDPATHAVVGMRKTLVFYTGRAPNGTKTNWVMHEFRLETPNAPPKEDWVLCRVFHKKKGDAMNYHDSWDMQQENNHNTSGCISSTTTYTENSSPPQQDNFPAAIMQPQGRIMCNYYEQMTSSFPCSTTVVPHHQEGNSSSNSFLNLALLHCDSPQELERAKMMEAGSNVGGGSDGSLMFDMGLEEHDFYGGGLMGSFGGFSSVQGGKEDHFFY
ncbi:hypothetical protein Cni_G26855 [Canna indica]|uniref:NAC domain-containing protein n=1 Tax=Canna indica TaxID=4628 RepID=A0AAQ3L6X2_9LILI|nr:hypothetical protein Cni_G26855 [Canna indica]